MLLLIIILILVFGVGGGGWGYRSGAYGAGGIIFLVLWLVQGSGLHGWRF